jgi:hypothetical protein
MWKSICRKAVLDPSILRVFGICCILWAGSVSFAQEVSPTIGYDGRLPEVTGKPLDGRTAMTFMIFQTLYGGDPLWSETREVEVQGGEFHIHLGEKVPIPGQVLNRPNLQVGMRVGEGKEIFPRNQLVQVVYVSSHSPEVSHDVTGPPSEKESGRPLLIDPLPLEKTTWMEAVKQCALKGKRLCRYREWYRGYEAAETLGLQDLRGHYEWVQPWVYSWYHYETLNPLFQGKEDGCEFWMIAPTNGNPYRCCEDPGGEKASATP